MSPEVASSAPYNHKADVYSYAVVLWELCALERPFAELISNPPDYAARVYGPSAERPPLNLAWPPKLQELMTEAWAADFHERPEFASIVDTLQVLVSGNTNAFGALEGEARTPSPTEQSPERI